MEGTVAIINGAAIAVGIEFNDTAGILTNGDADECRIGLALTSSKTVAITVLDFTGVRVTSKVGLALEFAGGAPAIAFDSELAAVASVVTGGVVIREALVVDRIAGIVDDCKAAVVTVGVSARWTGDA